jgi:uracil-DNA glycosylase
MTAKPRRNERGLVMPPGPRSIPRSPAPRRKRERPPEPPEVPGIVAKAAGDLVTIAAAVRACDVCKGTDERIALGSGYPRAPVMLVRDRPSVADLDAGIAFAEDGEALDKAFTGLGLPLSWVYGTCIVRAEGGSPCPDHLLAEIEAIEPSVLVAFGPRTVDGLRALGGRCGFGVPDEVPQGQPTPIRPGLVLIATEPLPEGVTQKDAKRRLWRDLQQIPQHLTAER